MVSLYATSLDIALRINSPHGSETHRPACLPTNLNVLFILNITRLFLTFSPNVLY